MQRGQKVIALGLQQGLVVGNSGGNEFGDATLDNSLNRFGILELFANSHLKARPYQPRHVGIEGMVREARQGY